MGDGKRARRAIAAGVPATLLLAFANPLPAVALHQPEYPSWDEVEQARHNEAAAAAKVEEIEGILIRLYDEAAQLNDVAMQAGEEYALASTALDEATEKLDRLKKQADAAQERAEESERRVGIIVAQLARGGGGDVTLGLLLGSSTDTDSLLARLGTADRLSDSSKALLDRAIYDQKTADALAADARAAERGRQRRADSDAVRTDQVPLQRRQVRLADARRRELAEPRVDAVDRSIAFGRALHHGCAGAHSRQRLRVHHQRLAAGVDGLQLVEREVAGS
jgi:chromosome segregation ATPase